MRLIHRKQGPGPTKQGVSGGPGAAVDTRGLERALRRGIEGEVRFDRGSRALYATDASNYRQVPLGLVVPRTMADVLETVRHSLDDGRVNRRERRVAHL